MAAAGTQQGTNNTRGLHEREFLMTRWLSRHALSDVLVSTRVLVSCHVREFHERVESGPSSRTNDKAGHNRAPLQLGHRDSAFARKSLKVLNARR